MIEGLKPYPEMKDTGVEWLENMPKHWSTSRAKWLFRKIERPAEKDDEVITCFRDGTVTLRNNRRLGGFTESLSRFGYQGIRRGDLVIHSMDAFAGAVGISDSNGMGTSVYSACTPTRAGINPYYYAYYIREMARNQWILALSKGIRERSTDFRYNTFSNQFVPILPIAEQNEIVRFLEHAQRRIKDYILSKQRLLQLLEEQKQTIIHQAVTGRFDVRTGKPYQTYKPSGEEWLGELPEHWEVRTLRHVLRNVTIRNHPQLTLLSVVREKGVVLRDVSQSDDNHNFIPDDLSNYKVVNRGFFAMNKMKAWQGSYGVSAFDGIVSPAYYVFSIDGVNEHFFHTSIRSRTYIPYFTRASDGVRIGQWDLSLSRMREIHFAIPPIAEQSNIVQFLDDNKANLENAVTYTRRQIDLIQEYRTRLVSDVVTGKLDVREAAVKLPNDTDSMDDIADNGSINDTVSQVSG